MVWASATLHDVESRNITKCPEGMDYDIRFPLDNLIPEIVSDIEDGFPFETTIVSEVFDGGKVKYKFS